MEELKGLPVDFQFAIPPEKGSLPEATEQTKVDWTPTLVSVGDASTTIG
jgi:hypothetical protein